MRPIYVAVMTTGIALAGSCELSSQGPQPLASKIVGPEGAHMEAPGISLDIPAGALASTKTISIYAGDAPTDGATPIGASFRFEPSGLEFAVPVTVHLDVPPGANGLVRWSRLGDASSFEFAGFIDDGVATAENTHFSTVGGTNDSPDQCRNVEKGDALCKNDKPPAQDCRQLCSCVSPSSLPTNAKLCPTKPSPLDADCPANPAVPKMAGAEESFGERNGEVCQGWGRVPKKVFLCNCRDDAVPTSPTTTTSDLLCPLEETFGTSGTWECHSTPSYPLTFGGPPGGPPPKSPIPAECVAGNPNHENCDFAFAAYVGASADDHSGCIGHDEYTDGADIHDQALVGHLEGCQETEIDVSWEPFDGTTSGCRPFDKDPDFPDMRSDDDLQRCRLTPQQWSRLQNRRLDCGMPPRGSQAWEEQNTLRNDEGKPVYVTSSILDVPDESSYGGLTELTGFSSRAWPHRSGASCPGAVPITHEYEGIGLAYPNEDGGWTNNNSTASHAEGNALLQLAEQRMRVPPVPDGVDPASGWGATGGRVGGCGELIVDREACEYACAPEGIFMGMVTAGLEKLVVHSPTECRVFTVGQPMAGVPCSSDSTSCMSP